jgi:aminoglycoside phosphotransferase (APT) family kinase protein
VLRSDAPSSIAASHGRAEEFALFKAAEKAGVRVPHPVLLCEDAEVLGASFFIMEHIAGTAGGRKLVRDPALASHGPALARRLGRELASIHKITPVREDLAFLPLPKAAPAQQRICTLRGHLDALPDPRPAIEYGLRWLELNAPEATRVVLCHGDFRTGNYMVEDGELTGILDWEFAGWSDPMEDVGWFCASCWRFGAVEREAGGIAGRADFYAGYNAVSDIPIDEAVVPYWEVMAAARWAVIALHQGYRHSSGAEDSLELALTGRMAPEMEFDLLTGIDRIETENGHA